MHGLSFVVRAAEMQGTARRIAETFRCVVFVLSDANLATAELVLKAWAALAEVWKTSWSIESRGEFSPVLTAERRGEQNLLALNLLV